MSLAKLILGIFFVVFAFINVIYGIFYCIRRCKEVENKDATFEDEIAFTILLFSITTVLIGVIGILLILDL